MTAPVVRAVIAVIDLYRHTVSPLRLPSCRFTPTCSQYAVEALQEFGLLRGGWYAWVRLLKCGPWHDGGWDPIPDHVSGHESHSDVSTECGGKAVAARRTGRCDANEPPGKSLPRV